ncbi:MAG TPA: PhnD/SsuA/transferrin family substrate-binding protein [Xanthobacteraceae bacterium]|jgi:4,5-dihydroxyphthalate decarboxylase
MKLQLSIALTSNPRTWPVIDGTVAPEAIDLVPTVLHPSELFWRQLRYGEFDVAEMSMSSLMIAKSKGDERFVGIPVFTTRLFFHTTMLVRRDAGIDAPSDLKGKRVGVPEYQQTAALWTRGALQHEFGVAPKDMEFWMERPPSRSHGGATGFVPPAGVTVHQIPPETNIGAMMLARELDAAMFYLVDPNLIDRSTADLRNHPDIRTLFPDPLAEGIRYHRKTGLYPINHGMVIKRELAEKHPWAITNILKAFNRANELANRQRREHVEYHLETGLLPADARKALDTPILFHGINANRRVLETIAQYSLEQGLTPRLMKLDELFAASMMAQ